MIGRWEIIIIIIHLIRNYYWSLGKQFCFPKDLILLEKVEVNIKI